jgi:hypothetical protein
MKPIYKHTSVTPVAHARTAAGGSVPEDFTAAAMRNIRSLQKQLQAIGERYQDELAHPKTSGPKEQEILREILRQMDSVQREIDAIQHSIIEHEAVEQLKKNKSTSPKIPNPELDSSSSENVEATNGADGVPSKVKAAAEVASSESPETSTKPTKVDRTRLVGSVIDTTA